MHGKFGWNGTFLIVQVWHVARPESLADRKKTIKSCFIGRALPRGRGSHFEKSAVEGGKTSRGEPARLGVGTGKDLDLEQEKRNTSEISIFSGNFPVE